MYLRYLYDREKRRVDVRNLVVNKYVIDSVGIGRKVLVIRVSGERRGMGYFVL